MLLVSLGLWALFAPYSVAESQGLVAPHTAAAAVAVSVATAVRIENGPDHAKLTFDLTRPVAATSFVLAAPDRIVVDIPDTDFHIGPQVGARMPVHDQALVASFRFGHFAPGKSRIVVDLEAPARIVQAQTVSYAAQSHLVIELARTTRAAFQAAAHDSFVAAETAAAATEHAPPVQQNKSALPLIVVDPGHGGVDSGAIVNGLVEKNIVFDFAKLLAAKLRASGHYKVMMTRDSDVFVSLAERVRIAQDSGAALFISIHADTISNAPHVAGATVYTGSEHATDAEAARTAANENQADAAAGVAAKNTASGVSDILADLTRQETRAYSHVFARTLVNYWRVAGRLNKNPERAAGFWVLKAPDVPSVLVELGYLSNAKDAASLTSPAWRDKTSTKVAAAIDAYFAVLGGNFGAEKPPAPTATALDAPAQNK
ncbi:MAG: N-acetylmuramoyl-L-alanine amidase [Methylovirgula sp.]